MLLWLIEVNKLWVSAQLQPHSRTGTARMMMMCVKIFVVVTAVNFYRITTERCKSGDYASCATNYMRWHWGKIWGNNTKQPNFILVQFFESIEYYYEKSGVTLYQL